MKYFLLLIIGFFFGKMLWRLVLKRSAYPETIPTKLKVAHAVILFYVLIFGWSGFYSLLTAIFHPSPTTWQADSTGGAFIGPTLVLYGLAGTALLFVCSGLAKREQRVLKYFFVLWPLTNLCSSYIAVIREQNYLPAQAIYFGVVFTFLIFAATIIFYFRYSKVLFNANALKTE